MSVTVGDREVPLGVGIAAGAAAELVTYFLVFSNTAARLRDSGARQLFDAVGADLPTWKAVGWVFFNAQFVETRLDVGLGTTTGSFIGDGAFVSLLADGGFSVVLYAGPPLVLVAAGLAVGQYERIEEPVEAAGVGAGVVVGYLLLILVDAFLFRAGDAGPVLATAVLFAGLGYPAVFGTLGAFLATLTD